MFVYQHKPKRLTCAAMLSQTLLGEQLTVFGDIVLMIRRYNFFQNFNQGCNEGKMNVYNADGMTLGQYAIGRYSVQLAVPDVVFRTAFTTSQCETRNIKMLGMFQQFFLFPNTPKKQS